MSADVMASNSESEQILEMAIAGISRVAQAIAVMPAEDRARALEAAERSYCQTALDLGYAEAQAESWAAALINSLYFSDFCFSISARSLNIERSPEGGLRPALVHP